ncbi:unnamed protein product [Calypogeia fissa]
MGHPTNDGTTAAKMGECFNQEKVVHEAINCASAETVRKFLKKLYAVSSDMKQMVENEFLAAEESGDEGPNDEKIGRTHEVNASLQNERNKQRKYDVFGPASGNKHVRPRFVACQQCREKFDVTKNNDKGCFWHDGELEVDEGHSTWYDWDETCHGDMDSDEGRKQYPEGFVWSCCEKDGKGKGCMMTAHKEVLRVVSSKKAKFGV